MLIRCRSLGEIRTRSRDPKSHGQKSRRRPNDRCVVRRPADNHFGGPNELQSSGISVMVPRRTASGWNIVDFTVQMDKSDRVLKVFKSDDEGDDEKTDFDMAGWYFTFMVNIGELRNSGPLRRIADMFRNGEPHTRFGRLR